ncbi:hypothetical protein [Microbacterium sp. 3H14]|nr:hypothetical protein [Microbacterium sp. 3H14]
MRRAEIRRGCRGSGDEMSPEPTLLMAVVFGGFLFLVVFFVGW